MASSMNCAKTIATYNPEYRCVILKFFLAEVVDTFGCDTSITVEVEV